MGGHNRQDTADVIVENYPAPQVDPAELPVNPDDPDGEREDTEATPDPEEPE